MFVDIDWASLEGMSDLESRDTATATTVETSSDIESGKTPPPMFLSHPVSSLAMGADLEHQFGDIAEGLTLATDAEDENVIDRGVEELLSSSTTSVHPENGVNPTTIRLISYSILKELDAFPRCPDDTCLITEFSHIDWKSSFIVFVSHCWLRGGPDCKGWEGFPHPDNGKHEKFQFCLDAIFRLWQSLAPSMEDCYVWMDFASLNQNAVNPGLELEHLDNIMEVCDCVLTPIVDDHWERWGLHLRGNLFVDYKAPSWRTGPLAYLNRAWCRMEMLYAATIPLRRESRPGGSRYLKFQGALKTASNQNRRPHFLYGSKEFYESKQLLTLPPLRNSYFHDFNPANGIVRYEEDRAKISSLMAELEKYRQHTEPHVPQNMDHPSSAAYNASSRSTISAASSNQSFAVNASTGDLTSYSGDVDESGRWHGYGVLTYENGDHYEGYFHHGLREGYGILTYANGDQYRGQFRYDKRQGKGVMIYGNGNRYVGSFHHGFRNGAGVLTFADGNVYDGPFVYGYQAGYGSYYQANGDYYEGHIEQDQWHGIGKWVRFSCGEVITGRFHKGKPVLGEIQSEPLVK